MTTAKTSKSLLSRQILSIFEIPGNSLAFSAVKKTCSNVELVTICGQLRTRDCRSLRMYLHCPTQPVIETTQRATTYPLPIDFDSVEEIVSDFGRSKFLNNWADVSALFSRSKITASLRFMTSAQSTMQASQTGRTERTLKSRSKTFLTSLMTLLTLRLDYRWKSRFSLKFRIRILLRQTLSLKWFLRFLLERKLKS